ncbi:hypothetical protein [Actinokineospora sp. NBRC 105648]|uniref:hypothetical protein n=1 Tax=Actinokineospora sp. NBRC 105648 TaxID=3032206 RepID=UPI0024A5B0AC|nr:hypothetical protein [Actinokineospora sp. NBRC 105648]GLZ36471.1 hypothetical protein Acsp05_00960 [Actinokineospora sp. NBRC 105648]
MPWNPDTCKWGAPASFTDQDAANVVNAADFRQAVFVEISKKDKKTKHAFTYVTYQGFRLCVNGHIHIDGNKITGPGNSYIPGWVGWDMTTPAAAVPVIGALPLGGTFPGDDRYPHPVPVPSVNATGD